MPLGLALEELLLLALPAFGGIWLLLWLSEKLVRRAREQWPEVQKALRELGR